MKKPTAKPAPKARARPDSKPTAKKKPMAGGFKVPAPDPAVQAGLDAVMGARGELRPGKMFGCPGYFVGAKAVACVFGAEVCLTLPASEIDALVARPGFRRFEVNGRTMSAWLMVDRPRVEAMARDATLVEKAIAYAKAKAAAQKPPRSA